MSSWIERSTNVMMPTYKRWPVVFVRGEGTWLYDEQGKSYLDCLGGISVVAVGHANPRVGAAVAEQMAQLVHVSNLFHSIPQIRLAERLTQLSGLDNIFFTNCGATANETAIKLARRWGQRNGSNRYGVISLFNSFHGRTLVTLAATGQPEKQADFLPLPPGFAQVKSGRLDELERAIGPETAAVLVETTQGEGGVTPLDGPYLREVRALCAERDLLLIVDDVQAGLGRTGTWFSWQELGFEPDIATVAKALGNGLPIGACLARAEVAAAFRPGDHGSTFGGGPVVCRAALAVLEEIEERNLLANCRERGEQLANGLTACPGVEAVRGRGLLRAAVLDSDRAYDVVRRALDQGLVVNNVRPNAVRFAPPLSISSDEIDEALRRFRSALQSE